MSRSHGAKQRATIQCLKQSLAEAFQVTTETLLSWEKTKHSPEKTISSPRVKTVLMGRVEKREPARKHQRQEEEMALEELADEREAVWQLAVKNSPSYSGCFEFGIRQDA